MRSISRDIWANYINFTSVISGGELPIKLGAEAWYEQNDGTDTIGNYDTTEIGDVTYADGQGIYDGSSALETSVDQMGSTSFFCGPSDSFTVSCAFNATGEGYIISKGGGLEASRVFGIFVQDGFIRLFLRGDNINDGTAQFPYVMGTDAIAIVRWDGSEFRAFIDTDSTGVVSSVGTDPDNAETVKLGARGDGAGGIGFALTGTIDDVQVYDTNLSNANIKLIQQDIGFSARFIMLGASLINGAWENELSNFTDEVKTEFNKKIIMANEAVNAWDTTDLKNDIDAILANYPDPSTEYLDTYCQIHIGGNNVTQTRPYSTATQGEKDTITNDITYIINAITTKGYIPVLGDLTFRNYDGTTAASPENGSLPYNENLIRALVDSDFKYASGKPWLQYYDVILSDYATYLDVDNVHHTPAGQQAMRDHFKDTIVNYVLTGTTPTELT
ncbi:MAG: hypothetical protein KAS32_29545 [Candidatus Peribacteraceae bacterium]|nr:hypothetical protein [Candidatus Peribacteraceae bacterium]